MHKTPSPAISGTPGARLSFSIRHADFPCRPCVGGVHRSACFRLAGGQREAVQIKSRLPKNIKATGHKTATIPAVALAAKNQAQNFSIRRRII